MKNILLILLTLTIICYITASYGEKTMSSFCYDDEQVKQNQILEEWGKLTVSKGKVKRKEKEENSLLSSGKAKSRSDKAVLISKGDDKKSEEEESDSTSSSEEDKPSK